MLDEPSKSTHENEIVRAMFDEAFSYYKAGETDKAKVILNETSLEGCTASMVILGNILSKGTEEERERSLVLYRMAGEAGDSSGYRNLAYCYAVGINTEKDKVKGAELYTESALMGNARAACNIGVMCDYGNGVEQDFKEAFEWYTKSAEGGCTRGMTNLGEYYLLGKGTEKNIEKALYWFKESGSPRAMFRLSEIYFNEEGYRDQKKGMEYLLRSATMGYSKGMVKMGLIVEKESPELTKEYMTQAAMKGNRDAIAYLQERNLPVPESSMSKRRKKSSE